jgi:hypothetical protein
MTNPYKGEHLSNLVERSDSATEMVCLIATVLLIEYFPFHTIPKYVSYVHYERVFST